MLPKSAREDEMDVYRELLRDEQAENDRLWAMSEKWRLERDLARRQLAWEQEARVDAEECADEYYASREKYRVQLEEAAECVRLLIARVRIDKRIHRARAEGNPQDAVAALRERWEQWRALPAWLRRKIAE